MRTVQNAPQSSVAPGALPFVGVVETAVDALRLVAAARAGLIPRIVRRLSDAERRSMIKSGAVFVFSVEESGVKRWTDGRTWSPSRIVGNFLVYREYEPTGRNADGGEVSAPQTTQPVRMSWSERKGHCSERPNGLCKKTITVVADGTDHHVVSYYTEDDVLSGRLHRPASRADLTQVTVSPSMVRATNFRYPPHIELGMDGLQYVRESARDEDEVLEHVTPGARRASPGRSSNDRVTGGTAMSSPSSLHRVDHAPFALHRWTLPLTNHDEPSHPTPVTLATHRASYRNNQIHNSTLATSSPSSHGQYFPTVHDHHDAYPVSTGWDAAQISSWTQ